MANTLRFKRGLASGIPTAVAGEPLFTTDTFDLYIGNGTTNTRFQKYIASGTTSQLLRGDGSLLTMPIVLTSPANGQVLKYNGTNWVNDSDAGITGSGAAGQVAYFTGATTQGGNNNLFWDSTNFRLGIRNNSPLRGLEVGADGTNWISATFTGGSGGNKVVIGNLSGNAMVGGHGSALTGWVDLHLAGANLVLKSGGDVERARFFSATGNFGIGTTTDNGLKLQVTGTGYFSDSVGIGSTTLTGYNLAIQKTLTGASTNVFSIYQNSSVQSDVTGTANGIGSFTGISSTTALGTLRHFVAAQGTFASGGTVTTQIGFAAASTLTSATNNYGFYGGIASGTGRWNLYMEGSANNYMAGSLGIGSTSITGINLLVLKNLTGAANAIGITSQGAIQSDATGTVRYFSSVASSQATTFTTTSIVHYQANQNAFGAGHTVTNQFGFAVSSGLTGATNNYGFYGDIAAATGRWNLYMNGTANNYMAGRLSIGTLSFINNNSLQVARQMTGATYNNGIASAGQIQSDVTVQARYFVSEASTQATTFTLTSLFHYGAFQGTFGAGSTVSFQNGFYVDSTMIGATYNYGFRGLIPSGTNRWNLYMDGTALNYLNGSLLIGSTTDSGEKLQVTGTMKVTGNTVFSASVGIGVSPATKLEVFDSVTTQLRVRMSGQADLRLISDTGYGALSNDSNMPLIFRTNATERMRISNAGNLLIGTATDSGEKIRVNGTILISNATIFSYSGLDATGALCGTSSAHPFRLVSNNVERLQVKTNGQVRFVPLSSAPSGAEAGDVYYNSTDNKHYGYNGTTWNAFY